MKKTIKKRAFVSAIAMLIVSAIVLTSSTFAWFSMSKLATIEQMDLTVSAPDGIQISANASAWTASLTNDDFFGEDSTRARYKAYDGNKNLLPKELFPVSSAFRNFSEGTAVFYKATLDDSGRASIVALEQTAGNDDAVGLVAFDIFFKVIEDTKVYFGTSEFTDGSNSDILTALRVAFQPLGTVGADASADTAVALRTTSNSTPIVYEPDSENRSADALSAGNSTGYVKTKYTSNVLAEGRVNNNYVLENNNTSELLCKILTDKSTATDKSFDLTAGITKMRVYVWVEGNDIDCRNSVAGAALSVALKFTID